MQLISMGQLNSELCVSYQLVLFLSLDYFLMPVNPENSIFAAILTLS